MFNQIGFDRKFFSVPTHMDISGYATLFTVLTCSCFMQQKKSIAYFIFNVDFCHCAPWLDWSESPGLQGHRTCSTGMCLTRPLTTVLGVASPTSTCSTYRESASGCFSAVRMRPTRRSRRDTSTFCSS